MPEATIWELAHPDGSSVFVQHTLKDGSSATFTFGPFFFFSLEDLQRSRESNGPHNLMRALADAELAAQEVPLDWVVENASRAFHPIRTDCIVVGGVLIPFSLSGAALADAALSLGAEEEPVDKPAPWTGMCSHWGVEAMRFINAGLIAQLGDTTAVLN